MLVLGGNVGGGGKGNPMLRSEFLALVPATLLTVACGDTEPDPKAKGSAGAGGSGSGGVSSPGGGGSTAEAGETTGTSVTGGSGAGGSKGSTGGTSGAAAQGGKSGAPPSAECLSVGASAGAVALSNDFSMNSDTGTKDEHTLLMDRGAMIRQQVDYLTTGEDHTHLVVFTLEQLNALTSGQTVVVETEGPPLNASSGHSHTVTVHPCPAAKR
jgi:hypothetical protein